MNTTTSTSPDGMTTTYMRNGSKLATIRHGGGAGRYHVATFIDYGDDGKVFCDGRSYKTVKGAERMASTFVGQGKK